MAKLEGENVTEQREGDDGELLLCRALAGSTGGVTNGNNTADLGNVYFAILQRPVGYFTFIHCNKTFFTRITTSHTRKLYLKVHWLFCGQAPCVFHSIAQIEDSPGHQRVPHPRASYVSPGARPPGYPLLLMISLLIRSV